MSDSNNSFFVTIPHSGERVPDSCGWLKTLPENILMCDVDRYVDRLYEPTLLLRQVPLIKTEWHRYAADLNRVPDDVDCDSVQGHANKAGSNNRGFHWVDTTTGYRLMPKPMSLQWHQEMVQLIYEPFHKSVRNQYEKYFSRGAKKVFHLDAHSMPSKGTAMHRDPGEHRAEIVVSDCKGASCSPQFTDLVLSAYTRAGFKVGYNWPYFGGRVSEQYGKPELGQHAIQAELNRELYMSEETKAFIPDKAKAVELKLAKALDYILANLGKL